MAEKPLPLPPADQPEVLQAEMFDIRENHFSLSYRLDVNRSITTIEHVTAERARMTIEVSRNQYAIPARYETARLALVAFCVLFATWVIYSNPATGWPLASMLMVFAGGTSAPKVIEKWRAKPTLEDKSGGTQTD